MEDVMFIHLENQPARYALTASKPHYIGIDMTPTAWRAVEQALVSEAGPQLLSPELDRPDRRSSKKVRKFGPLLTMRPIANGWIQLSCPLPRSTSQGSDPAAEDAINANVRLILSAIGDRAAHDSSVPEQQLLSITLMGSGGGYGYHCAGLVCGVSPIMMNWARSQSRARFEEVSRTMRSAYNTMVIARGKERDLSCFSVDLLQPGVLFLNCPANACGLGRPANNDVDPGRGYELRSHNVDFIHQQLTLLMGLAAIHDIARADLWPTGHS